MAEPRLEDRLSPPLDEAEIAQVWRGVRDERARRRGARRVWPRVALAGGALAVAALVLALVLWPDPSGPRVRPIPPLASAATSLEPGARVAGDAAAVALPISDGSRVEVARGGELEVLSNEGDKFVTAVRRGRARFAVKPGGPRRWVIETDLATVEVVGTAFAVDRGDDGLRVEVEHGVVLVRGERVPGRVVRLTAGQTLAVPGPFILNEVPSQSDGPSRSTVTTPAPAPAPATVTAPVTDPAPAKVTARVAPVPALEPAPVDGAAIIAQADALAARGQAREAAALLDRYLARAPADATAGLASFLLGRLAAGPLADPARAAAAFERTLAIGSPRAIQDEARTRRDAARAASAP